MMSPWLFLPLFVFLSLLLLAANFSALETALFVLREKNFGRDDTGKNSRLLSDTLNALDDALLLGSISNLLLAATGLYLILDPLHHFAWEPWIGALVIVGAGMITVEILPRACALRSPSVIVRCTWPLFRLSRLVLLPVAAPLRTLSRRLAACLTPTRSRPPTILSDKEILTLIDMRAEQGSIAAHEAALLHAATSMHWLTVRDAMTPRVDLPLMPRDALDDEALNMLNSARHPFVAIYDAKLDTISGLVDVQLWKLSGRPSWSTLSRPPVFVPETLHLLDAWRDHLQGDPSSVVVVVDEYGGFGGLLTHTDFTNRLLAKIAPAHDQQDNIQFIGNNRYLVSGGARLEEIARELGVELQSSSVDTIGGLIMSHFGYPPKPGQSLHLNGMQIKVRRTARARIQQLEIRVPNAEPS